MESMTADRATKSERGELLPYLLKMIWFSAIHSIQNAITAPKKWDLNASALLFARSRN